MAEFIVCDGGCGKISPDPNAKYGPHIANSWTEIDVFPRRKREYLSPDRRIYCGDCWNRVEGAMRNSETGKGSANG